MPPSCVPSGTALQVTSEWSWRAESTIEARTPRRRIGRRGWFDGEQAAVATTVADAASRERGQEARRAMVMRFRLTDRAEAAGDSPAGARVVDDSARPPGCEHSVSPRPITARQLQALVRQRFCEMPIPLTRESPRVTRNA